MPKRAGYWSVYHESKIDDCLEVYKTIVEVSETLENPWKIHKRGRPHKFHPKIHICLCIFMRFFDLSLREMEGIVGFLTNKSLDHSTFGKNMKKIEEEYMQTLIRKIHLMVDNKINKGVIITDSTGISTDRYQEYKIIMDDTKKVQEKKWHIIAKYYYQKGLISIISTKATPEHRNDSPVFREIFDKELCKNSLIFGDRGYDSSDNLKLIEDSGSIPVIKIRYKYGWRYKGIRKKYRKMYLEHTARIYKQIRGIVEGVFGGTQTRYGNKTRCRLERTRNISIMMLAVSHNIRTLMKSRVVESDLIVLLIYSTTPKLGKKT